MFFLQGVGNGTEGRTERILPVNFQHENLLSRKNSSSLAKLFRKILADQHFLFELSEFAGYFSRLMKLTHYLFPIALMSSFFLSDTVIFRRVRKASAYFLQWGQANPANCLYVSSPLFFFAWNKIFLVWCGTFSLIRFQLISKCRVFVWQHTKTSALKKDLKQDMIILTINAW